jgi:NAD(P)-dependent dehydrogenase (short-subunit alcohol dehydrogenase family)
MSQAVAVVTGASQGIGHSTAVRLALCRRLSHLPGTGACLRGTRISPHGIRRRSGGRRQNSSHQHAAKVNRREYARAGRQS